MIRIIADESVQSTLEGITETIELRSKHGELLGFFHRLRRRRQSSMQRRQHRLILPLSSSGSASHT
jgi:hypothetical protein